jgi:hypothetical protein
MKASTEECQRLRKALGRAYWAKEKGGANPLWLTGVMGHVRRLSVPGTGVGFFDLFEPFVWRLAPVACSLVLILAAVISQLDFLADYEVARMLMVEPLDSSFFQILNV